jgi:competence ComEA-like helix-hairpin-helix protein
VNEEIKKINLNTADRQTLDDLPGIGPALAERIIEYRETVHPFEEVIELVAVPGVSEKMVREIEHLLEVKAADDFQPGVILTVENVTEMGGADEETAATPEPELELETAEPSEPEIILEAETWEQEEDLPAAEDNEDEDDAFIVPYDPPPPAPTIVQQGYSLRALLASSLLTAVTAVLLTLGLLYLLNGTLYFASSARADRIEARGDEALQGSLDIAAALGNLTSRVNALGNRVNDLVGQQRQSEQELTAVENDITALQESTGALDERLTGVAAAAANFDQFLDGLRDLLLALQGEPTPPDADTGTPDEPIETVVHTMTPDAQATAEREATLTRMPPMPTATVTPAVAPTRTPRPTATPLP